MLGTLSKSPITTPTRVAIGSLGCLPLWLLLMLQKMMEEEGAFWHGLDVDTLEELELGIPTPNIWLKDVGQWVWWGPEPEPAPEGPTLSPLGAEPMAVDGTEQVQEEGAVMPWSRSTLCHPELA